MRVSPNVLVLPSEVAAVTQDNHFRECSRIYLRGGGAVTHVFVARPVAEVADLLDQARTAGSDPAP